MACKVGLILYVIVYFIAFVLFLIGTPIDMYRSKDANISDWNSFNSGCLTLWGWKDKCGSTKYPENSRTDKLYGGCKSRKTRFQAAEAFSIITIILMLLAVILGFVQLCCCGCLRWVCLVLSILAFICGIIPWAIVADSYSKGYSDKNYIGALNPMCYKMKLGWKYGAGFALLIVGWALGLISIIFLMLPC